MDCFGEELIHAYQNAYYPGGIGKYSKGKKGFPNVEFEAKFFRDVMCFITTGACAFAEVGNPNNDKYFDLMEEIGLNYKNNGSFQSALTSAQQKTYFKLLEGFSKKHIQIIIIQVMTYCQILHLTF